MSHELNANEVTGDIPVTTDEEIAAMPVAEVADVPAATNEEIADAPAAVEVVYEVGKLYNVDPFDLNSNPNQPRKTFNQDELDTLIASVQRYGVLQSLLAEGVDGKLIVVAGERRMRAAQTAKLETIPVIITSGSTSEKALVENLIRADLTALEEAEAVMRLKEESSYKSKDIAIIIGKAESTVSEIISLSRLPDSIKDKIRGSKVYTRANLLGIVGKDKDESTMIIQFTALEEKLKGTSKSETSVVDQMTKTIERFVASLNKVEFAKLEDHARTKLTKELETLSTLICQKTTVEA